MIINLEAAKKLKKWQREAPLRARNDLYFCLGVLKKHQKISQIGWLLPILRRALYSLNEQCRELEDIK